MVVDEENTFFKPEQLTAAIGEGFKRWLNENSVLPLPEGAEADLATWDFQYDFLMDMFDTFAEKRLHSVWLMKIARELYPAQKQF